MVSWRTSKNTEFLVTLSLLVTLVVTVVEFTTTEAGLPGWALAILALLVLSVSGAFLFLSELMELETPVKKVIPLPLSIRLVAVTVTWAVASLISISGAWLGHPLVGIVAAGIVAAPVFLKTLAVGVSRGEKWRYLAESLSS